MELGGLKSKFIEMLCAFLAVAGVNLKLADCRVQKERLLTHSNDAFKYQVQNKWDDQEWVDQHMISVMYETITRLDHNV